MGNKILTLSNKFQIENYISANQKEIIDFILNNSNKNNAYVFNEVDLFISYCDIYSELWVNDELAGILVIQTIMKSVANISYYYIQYFISSKKIRNTYYSPLLLVNFYNLFLKKNKNVVLFTTDINAYLNTLIKLQIVNVVPYNKIEISNELIDFLQNRFIKSQYFIDIENGKIINYFEGQTYNLYFITISIENLLNIDDNLLYKKIYSYYIECKSKYHLSKKNYYIRKITIIISPNCLITTFYNYVKMKKIISKKIHTSDFVKTKHDIKSFFDTRLIANLLINRNIDIQFVNSIVSLKKNINNNTVFLELKTTTLFMKLLYFYFSKRKGIPIYAVNKTDNIFKYKYIIRGSTYNNLVIKDKNIIYIPKKQNEKDDDYSMEVIKYFNLLTQKKVIYVEI